MGFSAQTMGAVSNGMSMAGVATGAIGAVSGALGARRQAGIDETNAKLAELGAQAALLQGQHEEEVSRLQTANLKSTQRTTLAANGVDLGSDSAVRQLSTTDLMGEIDAKTVKSNAVRTAFGYRVQATSLKNQADARRANSPLLAGATSLISGGGRVARQWYTLNKNSGGD